MADDTKLQALDRQVKQKSVRLNQAEEQAAKANADLQDAQQAAQEIRNEIAELEKQKNELAQDAQQDAQQAQQQQQQQAQQGQQQPGVQTVTNSLTPQRPFAAVVEFKVQDRVMRGTKVFESQLKRNMWIRSNSKYFTKRPEFLEWNRQIKPACEAVKGLIENHKMSFASAVTESSNAFLVDPRALSRTLKEGAGEPAAKPTRKQARDPKSDDSSSGNLHLKGNVKGKGGPKKSGKSEQ